MEKKKTKAEIFAEFIVTNWHFCPVDDTVSVPACIGWRMDKECCQKCLLKNAHNLSNGLFDN